MTSDHEEESRKLLARMEWAILEDIIIGFCTELKEEAQEQVLELFSIFKKKAGVSDQDNTGEH